MSANHALLGPSALKSRLTGSLWKSCFAARFSPEGRLAQARVTPRRPFSRMMRATRFWEVDTPAVFGLMNVFGAPYMPMLASYSPPIILASSKSRNACLLAGLPAHR